MPTRKAAGARGRWPETAGEGVLMPSHSSLRSSMRDAPAHASIRAVSTRAAGRCGAAGRWAWPRRGRCALAARGTSMGASARAAGRGGGRHRSCRGGLAAKVGAPRRFTARPCPGRAALRRGSCGKGCWRSGGRGSLCWAVRTSRCLAVGRARAERVCVFRAGVGGDSSALA